LNNNKLLLRLCEDFYTCLRELEGYKLSAKYPANQHDGLTEPLLTIN